MVEYKASIGLKLMVVILKIELERTGYEKESCYHL